MKKKINTDALADELRQHSAFFRRPSPPPPTDLPAQVGTDSHEARQPVTHESPKSSSYLPAITEDARPPRTGSTPPTPVRRRTMVRHPFEVYQDQVQQLRELALQERMNGGAGSMSKMVRDAIDRMIEERRREGEQ